MEAAVKRQPNEEERGLPRLCGLPRCTPSVSFSLVSGSMGPEAISKEHI